MPRVGLIGFGSIAEYGHLPALQGFPGVEVVAVSDLSPARLAHARAALPNAALFDSPAELIARADLDALDICSPPSTHVELIEAACRSGIANIVCEKPFVLSEEEYARVARARAGSGSRVVSVDNWRYSDLNRQVTCLLTEGKIGCVRSVELHTGRTGSALGNDGWHPRWRTDPLHSGGGIILDHGWHQLYLLLGWMRAPVQNVRAVMRTIDPRHAPVEDEAEIELEFPRAMGRIVLSWAASERSNAGVIRGTDGEITIYDDSLLVHNGANSRLPFRDRLTQSSYHPEWFREMFRQKVLDRDRGEADRNFAEAGDLVSIIGAVYRSAGEQGMPFRPSGLERRKEADPATWLSLERAPRVDHAS